MPLDAAALGRRRVLQVAGAARLKAGGQHRLRAVAAGDRVGYLRHVGPGRLGRAGTAAVRRRLTAARRRGVAPPVGRVPAAGTAARLPTARLLTAGLPAAGPPAEGRGRRDRRWRRGRRGGPGVTGRRDGCRGGSGGLSRGRGGLLRRAARRNTGKGTAEPELRSRADLFDDRVLLDLELQVEQVADRLFLDAVHHGVEHVVALPLVLDQRVALRHRAQADALAEVVHLVQVLAPLAVKDG